MHRRRFGAQVHEGGVHFSVWAPAQARVGLVIEGRAASEMKDQAIKMGLLTLRRTGLLNAMRGRTTLEEVIRMTMGD